MAAPTNYRDIINRNTGVNAGRTRSARTSQIRRGMRNRARRVSAGGAGG